MMTKNNSTPSLWLMFLLVGFPQFSETVYAPALPNIAHILQTSNHLVQWTLSLYFIGFALGVFFWGRYSDHKGRRFSMLIGLGIYIIGSLLCLGAQSITWLLLSRLVQGFGASCGSVLIQTIARETLPDHRRHQFFSSAGFVIAFSIALGPFVGGYLTQWLGWRSNFTLLFVIGCLMLLMTYRHLPETLKTTSTQRIKIYDVFIQLIKDKRVIGCTWIIAAVNGILFSYYAESPFIFIRILHLSASQYGTLGAVIALAALFGSVASKRLIKSCSVNSLLTLGCSIMVASSVLLMMTVFSGSITPHHKLLSTVLIMLPMMGLIFGSFGFLIPLTLSTALQKYQNVLGTAGALFGLSYYLIISFLTWIMGFIHNGTVIRMPVYFCVLTLVTTAVFFKWVREK
jgi:Bcr/CflA subfamily drug resistance transporter